ncbi:flavin reductase family protein [Amycolatopsis sp. WQ 127309]|uniref:flavin reductase family protein n=1 Tax=Amycolatopsis sp. WQ 127309 TaxID=2932773 RepID=UPI001FF3CE9B|nr:flavin reductase family protein [Amycolatopsis sp. WQ 127309]UOZ03586.1 flavin reductase family protein [Amycolatopsis sp. WQ 127309]
MLPARDRVGAAAFRRAMGNFATGVAVLGVHHAGASHGTAVSSLTSVSLRPPMVLVCLARESRTALLVRAAGRFALTVLGERDHPAVRRFSDGGRPDGAAQFTGLAHRTGPHTGAPLLTGGLAWLECEVARTVEGGDHDVVLAAVLDVTSAADRAPLVHFRGDYARLGGPTPRERGSAHGIP